VSLPIPAILCHVLLKGQLRVHPLESVAEMVDIFVSTTRPESVLDVFEVSLVKLLAFLGVIYF